ncbi:hypothetical protein AB3S75_023768 [Citrus x aurantiifolia]
MAKMIKLYGFASPVSPKALKDFLEEHTGEGTVSNVEVGQNKGLKAHAVVEFTTVEAADLIKSLAGNSYLKASDVKRRTPHYKLGDKKLRRTNHVAKPNSKYMEYAWARH